jgi:hypothetical protein
MCRECQRLAKGYHRALKERARIEDRMTQAMAEFDLGRFEALSEELDNAAARVIGVKAAVDLHDSAPVHSRPRLRQRTRW